MVERRLSFGGVASLYDRFRPSYPEELIDDVLAFARVAPGDRVVEVGAGTGKATALFAARGTRVAAIEPSPEMAAVLAPGGALAIFFSRPRWSDSPLYDELDRAYRATAPDLGPQPGPMRPANEEPELWGEWARSGDAVEAFTRPERRLYEWRCHYTTEAYTSLLQTHSDHILLAAGQRDRLLAAVAEVLDGAGGGIELTYVTKLWLAERLG